MRILLSALIVLALSLGSALSAQPVASQPASSRAVAELSSGDPAIDAVLDRLEAKGKAIRDLSAKVTKAQIETFPVEDIRTHEGVLLFRRFDGNPRFLIRFTRFVAGGIVREGPDNEEWFVFDGQWLTERQDKAKFVKRQQVLAPGEKLDVFKLGQGPFPMPIGQSRRDMLTHFTIQRGPAGKDDPPDCDHLRCTVRPESSLSQTYKSVSFFVDRKLDLPVRVVAERTHDEINVRVTLSDVRLNTGLAASALELPPTPKDFQVTEERLPARPVPVPEPR